MKIQSIKPQLTPLRDFWNEDARTLRIPTIQRQFVWDAEDVRDLIDSIVSGYPIGAIIIWEPSSEFPSAPLIGKDGTDARRYVLDGQQRLTALSLVMNGWEIDRRLLHSTWPGRDQRPTPRRYQRNRSTTLFR